MARKTNAIIREYLAALGKKGGRARAAKHDPETLSEWAKQGGRPRKPLNQLSEAGRYQRQRRERQRKKGK